MKLFFWGGGSEIVWPRWIIHSLSPSIFLETSWLYFSLELNSIPFSMHTSFSLYVICWWTTRREKIWGNRKPYSRRPWAWRVWTRGGASCGGSRKWREEARVTLSLSDVILSAFGKYRGFQKESDVSGLNQQVHEEDIPGRLSRLMGVHIERSDSNFPLLSWSFNVWFEVWGKTTIRLFQSQVPLFGLWECERIVKREIKRQRGERGQRKQFQDPPAEAAHTKE